MYSKIFRNLLFPVIERCYGTNIQQYLAMLNKTQWWSRKELEELQNKKLRSLISQAYHNVPYYHKIFRELNLGPEDIKSKEELQKLPILTKEIIRKNLPDLLARNIEKASIMERHSSGSTGEPLKYYIDKRDYSFGWAQTFRCWGWAGFKLGDPYVKVSLNPRDTKIKKLQDIIMNCKYIYASADISNETFMKCMERIRKTRPKIIRGYASSMYIFSKYLEDFNLNNDWNLYGVMTTGDTLFPHYRKLIESKFNTKVYDGYGGEGTPIAFECEKHEGYHLCDETAIIEFIKDNQPATPGEISEIIFTSLDNYAMPFIRYKINDVGRASEDCCSCGRGLSVMKSVEGRDTDIVVTPNKGFLVVHFFTILFEYIEGVDQFQVIQDSIEKLKIKIVRNDKFTNADLEYIISRIKKHAGEEMSIEVKFVNSIPPTRSGKRRFIISKVPLNF